MEIYKEQKTHEVSEGTRLFLIALAIITWRYVFSFIIDTWSPQGILLINIFVVLMLVGAVMRFLVKTSAVK